MTKEEIQFNKMTKTPTKRLIIKLGIPTIISMLVTSIYSIVDTYFVTQLGTSASGAVNVVYPLMAIIQAIGFTLGMGAGSDMSAKLGERKEKDAQIIASSAFYTSLLVGLVLTIIGLIFIDPIVRILGSTDTVLPYAKEYAQYILFGAPIMAGAFVLNNLLRAEGKSKFSMIGLTIGGIINIGLDPLFIYELKLGISGAAIATIISETISFLILLSFFLSKKSLMTLSYKNISKKFFVYGEIVKIGSPSLFRQGLASIATILLNNQAKIYGGDPALSAMGIVVKIFMVIFAIALGIGQGYQPVVGYNYAAKNYTRVKEAIYFTFIFSTIFMSVLGVICFFFSKELIMIFMKSDLDVINIGSNALKYQCISLSFISLNLICNMTFQSIRKKWLATLLSCCRQGVFFIPLVFILPACFKLTGVELIQPVSDILTFVFTIPFTIYFLCKLNLLIKEEKKESIMED